MKCPFCAEEIQDKASVCRFCSRDLTFFRPVDDRLRPVEERLNVLEKQYRALTESVAELASSIASARPEDQVALSRLDEQKADSLFRLLLLSVLLPFLISTLPVVSFNVILPPPDLTRIETAYEIPSHVGTPEEREAQDKAFEPLRDYINQIERSRMPLLVFGIVFLLVPIPSGFWLALRWRGSHLRTYLFLGLAEGVVESVAISLSWYLSTKITAVYFEAFLIVCPIIIARAILGFTSGALIGDFVERKLFPGRIRSGFAEKIAAKLIGTEAHYEKDAGVSQVKYADRIKTLANIITALAPILTLLGTLITAYFGYKAAVAAATKAVESLPK